MPSCTYGRVSTASNELENLCRQAHGFPRPEDVHRQVRAGASVLTHCPGYFMPILHHFVLHGKVDCVAACLSSHSVIDFTETRNKWEFTAFHCVARKNSPEISRALLSLLFDRLKMHSNDTFDWSVEDLHFDNFISALARYQQLSTSLALLKLYLPLSEMVPISLNLVWLHDWEALGEEQKYFAVRPNSILRASEATRELSHLCQTKKEQITLQKVESCIKEGADIVFRDPDMNYSIFHYFILNGMTECVSVSLSTSLPIDFTVIDDGGFTPLHFVCFKENSAETAIKMLTDIIDRIERFPDDIFSFSQTSCAGLDFISCAARYQKLSVLWPVVKAVPFFDDKVNPISLVTPVWRYDWEELGEHEQKRFALKKGVIEANRSTAMFVRECELCEWRPAVNKIENHILNGANIFFSDLDMNKPAFFQFIIDGMVDIVTVCMKNATSPLDFRTTGKHGMTSLHCLASRPFATDKKNESHNGDTVQILSLILHRLCTHPFDAIDWKQKDDDGYDFISYAAYYGNLSSFWPLIKNIFPLEESSGVVDLFLPVVRDDWDRLRSEQKYFKLASAFARPFR